MENDGVEQNGTETDQNGIEMDQNGVEMDQNGIETDLNEVETGEVSFPHGKCRTSDATATATIHPKEDGCQRKVRSSHLLIISCY